MPRLHQEGADGEELTNASWRNPSGNTQYGTIGTILLPFHLKIASAWCDIHKISRKPWGTRTSL